MRMCLKNNEKKTINHKKLKVIILLILIFFIVILIGKLISNISFSYMEYAKSEALEMVNLRINNSIKQDTFDYLKDDLFYVTKNSNNEIEMIDYNTYKVNLFLDKVSSSVQEEITELTNEKKTFYIPFFSIFNNPLISNIGPNIPVRLSLTNAVYSNVEIRIKEYGVNNCMVEIYILLQVDVRVILPVISDTITIKNEIPISYKIINGKIPEYYGGSMSANSSIFTLPIE